MQSSTNRSTNKHSFLITNDHMSDREDIIKIVETFFEIGKTKDLSKLKEIQLDDTNFSSFSDVQPYDLKDYKTSIALEELRFVSISDYDYEIKNPKISI